MTTSAKVLVPTVALPVGTSTPYTCTTLFAIIDKVTAYNYSTAITLTFTVGIGSTLMKKNLQPFESYLCPEIVGHTLRTGESLIVTPSTGTLAFRVSGREIT